MKKIILSTLVICLLLTGCKNNNAQDVLKEFSSKVNNADSYYLKGTMELVNNEDIYIYSIDVSYKKDDLYKIELENTVNQHKQIILRNSEGVFIITPSLNKSFKFQSDWPYNNSQVYLLSSLLEDIMNDENRTFEKNNNEYIFKSSVNYPNNEKLVAQKVYFGEDYLPKRVEVIDKDNVAQIKIVFDKIDLRVDFNDTYFDLDSILDMHKEPVKEENSNPDNNSNTNPETQEPNDNNQESDPKTKETATIDDIIYPMYLPVNTYLTNTERVNTESGERLILTFSGDKGFVLMEQIASYSDTPEIIPTYGDAELVGSSVAVVNDNSANWFQDGIEYYLVSDVMNTEELLEVVRSISVLPVSK